MSVERIEVNGHELTAFDLPPEPSETYEVHVDGLGEIVVEKGKPPKEKDVPAMYMRKLVPELCEQNAELHRENAKLRDEIERLRSVVSDGADNARELLAENAKLREQLERVQPTDCEGNVLDIADTVHMLRSEYDGDHEWEDVVTELVLTKWGGDRWIVRGSKGEAWACECAKTGYDEDAYEASDDVEPFGEPTLLEAENAKLRKLVRDLWLTGSLCDAIPDMRLQAKDGDWRTMQERVDEALGIGVSR